MSRAVVTFEALQVVIPSEKTAPAADLGRRCEAAVQVAKDYRTLRAVARKHGVAVIGGPVLVPTADACRRALEAGGTVFCLGLDSMGSYLPHRLGLDEGTAVSTAG